MNYISNFGAAILHYNYAEDSNQSHDLIENGENYNLASFFYDANSIVFIFYSLHFLRF